MPGPGAYSLPWGHRVIYVQKVIESISGVQETNRETGKELEDSKCQTGLLEILSKKKELGVPPGDLSIRVQ